jgi:hypothetical protein
MTLLNALVHALIHMLLTWIAILLVWAVWFGWSVFVQGQHAPQHGGAWGVFRFAMFIALSISLVLCGIFFTVSLVARVIRTDIPRIRYWLSSVTLALSSLLLLLVLPQGGAPLYALLFGLPLLSGAWMWVGTGRKDRQAGWHSPRRGNS